MNYIRGFFVKHVYCFYLRVFAQLLLLIRSFLDFLPNFQICPGLNANEIQIPYDKHDKVSLLVKSHLNTHSSVKYEIV